MRKHHRHRACVLNAFGADAVTSCSLCDDGFVVEISRLPHAEWLKELLQQECPVGHPGQHFDDGAEEHVAEAPGEPDTTIVVVNPGWVRTDMGGSQATLTPAESVKRLRDLIETLGPAQSGKFFNHDGREYPW